MMHQSIATIDSPEFINLQPLEINPLMSKCEIKVLYLGENRNHSYITKEVATDMAKTLRGAPIVGYYKEDKQDFADHGEKIIFDDEGVKFECMTKPYGFVAPDANVWFQKFEDTDDFGNKIEREYLMTTGYLWTGQYEECKSVIESGKPQSMELDEENLNGHWSTDNKTGMDFFIINDAIFSKLCILGDDVEPCFEGSSITAPEVSTSFTKIDDNFKKTLYTMMQDLKFALEGGQKMAIEEEKTETLVNEENTAIEEIENATEEITNDAETAIENTEAAEEENSIAEEVIEENSNEEVDNEEQSILAENDNSIEVESNPEENFTKEEEESKEENLDEPAEEEKSYALLESEYENLKTSYSELEVKYEALVEFKNAIENEKKDALINSFYMLSDEDKAEVIENKDKYSLEEIEAKLAVVCLRKGNFDINKEENTSEESKEEEKVEEDVVTYNLNSEASILPEWLKAAKRTRDSKKNI